MALVSCGDGRGGDVPAIRAELEQMPGVHVVDVVGWDEMWPLFGPEDVRADLEVGDSGRLVLCGLTLAAVRGEAPFIIARIGNWAPQAMSDRDIGKMRYVAGCANSVDVKGGSAFLEKVGLELRSPADVVRNYERLAAEVDSWPKCSTRIPAPGRPGYIEYSKTEFRDEFVQ